MNQEPIKICVNCGEEYSPEALACAECGGRLVFPQEYEKRSAPLEDEEARVLVRQGTVSYLRELAELLQKNGIRTDIQFHGCEPGTWRSKALYGLYVKTTDEQAAKEIDRIHWLQGAPEHASSFKYEGQELQGVCPACSTSVPEGTAECPECGLMVNPEAEVAVCPECDAEVGLDVKQCPNCGVEFE